MSKNIQFAHLNECASYMLIFVQRIRAFFPAGTSDMRIKRHLAFQTWRGAACSAWRRPRRLWEPQATPLQRQSRPVRVFQRNHSSDLNPSVSSVTPPEFLHGLKQIVSAEVRPKFLSYVDFGIAQLPEQKIRNPHFSRSSNE